MTSLAAIEAAAARMAQLHDFIAGNRADVVNHQRNFDHITRNSFCLADREIPIGKLGIAQAVSERIGDGHLPLVVIPIPDEDILAVINPVISHRGVDVSGRIAEPFGEGFRKPSGRVRNAEEDVLERFANALPGVPNREHRAGFRFPLGAGKRRSADDRDHRIRLRASDGADQADLLRRQADIGTLVAL